MSRPIPGYEPVRPLGSGASGEVVLARHEETGTPVAIKYLSDALCADIEHLAAFRAEARLLAGLVDDHVVRLYEYVESGEGAAIVMELVNGPTLRAMLREQGPIEAEAALVVLHGSLLGLAAAHAVEVVHRDYKPANVLIDGAGRSKLADFGIALPAGADRTASAGTPAYLAPECWREGTPSPAADVYAATATFFECLTGHPPFVAAGADALRRQHANAPVPAEEVPKPLRDLVRRGLAKDPARRPADAAAFAVDLDAVAGAAYGTDWREKGRRHLARRAALLSLLWPLPAGAAATVIARTLFGRPVGAWLLGAIPLAAVLIGGIGIAVSQPGTGRPVADQNNPLATTSITPSHGGPATSPTRTRTNTASPSRPGRTPTRSATHTRSSAPTSAPPPTPSSSPHTRSSTSRVVPPPPSSSVTRPPSSSPVQSLKVTITTFVWSGGTIAKSTVVVSTATTAPVTLKLVYYESDTSGEPQTFSGSSVRTLSGHRSYTIDSSNNYSACTPFWVLQAVTSPGASNGTQTSSVSPPASC